MSKKYPLNVSLDLDQEKKLKEICAKRRIDMSKQVRIWIDEDHEKLKL